MVFFCSDPVRQSRRHFVEKLFAPKTAAGTVGLKAPGVQDGSGSGYPLAAGRVEHGPPRFAGPSELVACESTPGTGQVRHRLPAESARSVVIAASAAITAAINAYLCLMTHLLRLH